GTSAPRSACRISRASCRSRRCPCPGPAHAARLTAMTANTKVITVRSLPDKSARGELRRRGRTTGENTAEEIRSVALDLFYKRGFQATTLRDIAAKVGIQVGSLYNHIASKGELLFEIME